MGKGEGGGVGIRTSINSKYWLASTRSSVPTRCITSSSEYSCVVSTMLFESAKCLPRACSSSTCESRAMDKRMAAVTRAKCLGAPAHARARTETATREPSSVVAAADLGSSCCAVRCSPSRRMRSVSSASS